MTLGIGQVVHLEPVDEVFNRLVAGEQGRHGDERRQLVRHAVLQLQGRERLRAQDLRHRVVDEGDRGIRGRE